MQQAPRLYYGDQRKTWHGVPRVDIEDRERPPVEEWQPFVGLIQIRLPFFDLDWTLRQDSRDPRRFRALDLEGNLHAHAAPRELMRQMALIVPQYSGRR